MLFLDRMSMHPVIVHEPDDYKKHAMKIIEHHTLRHLPAPDEHDHLVGILAEHDLLLAATQFLNCAVEVKEVM